MNLIETNHIVLKSIIVLRFSTNKAFAIQLSEINDIAGQHETISEDMMNSINKVLLAFCIELKNEKKKVSV